MHPHSVQIANFSMMNQSRVELISLVLFLSFVTVLCCISTSSQNHHGNRLEDASYYNSNKDSDDQDSPDNNLHSNEVHKVCTVTVATKVEQHRGHCVKLSNEGAMGCKTPNNILVPYHQECYAP